ncbi:MAG TPA: hydroxylamine reductase [Candidatus Paceibacterota bacterium]|nr:hydroxylamine reductase [Candidatus Paceibacterota bacterium]HRZ54245.1 hydroxylamine reductase [Candidatus Paceibacterota bacterium]
MFCYQCEQTSKGTGCTVHSTCGKDETTAALQDVLLHAAKGVAQYNYRARQLGVSDREIDRYILKALFITVTNVNFDADAVERAVRAGATMRDRARALYERAAAAAGKTPELLKGPATWVPAPTQSGLVAQAGTVSILVRRDQFGADAVGLQELLIYGLKGAAAYADHALALGMESDEVYAFFSEALTHVVETPPSVDALFALNMKCGEVNLKVMEMLDRAHTTTFGHPVPTPVRIEPVKGKCILVSGHDLHDLEVLLRQTEGKGVNIYTHGEMLPAHGYPGLKKYKHLVGNFGGAWQDQKKEFAQFPGAILMTTNCIIEPQDSYKGRIFSTGNVGWPGVRHVLNGDFTPVIDAALAAPGFAEDGPDKTILVGFGHNAVLGVADQVVAAVKSGAIRHFFLVGGCDGAKTGRNYYTDFAELAPKDTVILTLACGKFRFNKLDFGTIGGIPRLLDAGQCNDAYSAIQIAVALSKAFGCGVNELPLSLILSWFEQKAVAILLTLLYLGIRNIRIGPSLPAFITPAVLQVLVDKFDLKPIAAKAQDDLDAILGRAA